jgi:hypothetical protein
MLLLVYDEIKSDLHSGSIPTTMISRKLLESSNVAGMRKQFWRENLLGKSTWKTEKEMGE